MMAILTSVRWNLTQVLICISLITGFPGGSVVKNSPANAEDVDLHREDPLEKEMATHSSTFAWKIP